MPTGVMTGSKQPLWTEERDILAEYHLKDGLSYSQVAAKLGGVSRCAVLSRARRMGYALHGGKPEAGREKRPTRAKASTPRVVASKAAPAPIPVAINEHMSPSQKKVAIVKAMAAVTPPARLTPHPVRGARQCCYPLGDPRLPDFKFCEDAAETRGMCGVHYRGIMAQAVEDKSLTHPRF